MFITNLCNSRLLLCLVLLFLTACGGDKPATEKIKVPDNLISEEKMIELMLETQLLEAKIVDKRMGNDKAVKTYNKFERKIFEKYGLDSNIYYSNYEYYLSDLETFNTLITAVTDTLKQRKERKVKAKADK